MSKRGKYNLKQATQREEKGNLKGQKKTLVQIIRIAVVIAFKIFGAFPQTYIPTTEPSESVRYFCALPSLFVPNTE